jgi:hypothetical protein
MAPRRVPVALSALGSDSEKWLKDPGLNSADGLLN